LAAGLSSAVTAPLAAAVTARGLFASGPPGRGSGPWSDRSVRFRAVWIAVLLVGLGFGLAEVRPVPAILLAQALNGILLPLVAVFLLLTVNDRRLMGALGLNGGLANAVLGLVVAVTVVLGVAGVGKAAAGTLGFAPPGEGPLLLAAAALTALGAIPVWRGVLSRRRTPTDPGQ
jgi:Mn2+/Fe2+ NRAMP family transporter